MPIDFPNSPSTNQTYSSGGVTWRWDGAKWRVVGGITQPKIQVSDTPPTGASAGDAWLETDTGSLFVFQDGFWVAARVPNVVGSGAIGTTQLAGGAVTTEKLALGPTFVSALPSSPVNGQEVYYQSTAAFAGTDTMASTGAVWHLRYRAAANGASAGSGAWEFVGGSSLTHEVTANESRSNTTYGDLTTVGPAVSLPLKGDYRVETYAVLYVTSGTSAQVNADMSYAIGATAAVDADSHGAAAWGGYNSTVQAVIYPTVRERVKTGLGAVTLTMKYRTSNTNGSGNWSNRRMTVTPIKVWL